MFEECSLQNGVSIFSGGFLMILQLLVLEFLGICPLYNGAEEQLTEQIKVRIYLLASLVFVQGRHQPKLLITTLIDRYTLTRTAPYMYYTESDSDSEGHLTGDDSYTEFIDHSESEESESEEED